ncbi:hypothetical protein Anas_14613 [Armadillidium nasatum]|uniref:Uncharacterized protein n=1 Tax=Armadillidium nasatum TaxID=96803 RepID=A0A5N5SMG7_9CRUS|nr:hypothetical protein Anas_14613 [Armadillidium nasatum]
MNNSDLMENQAFQGQDKENQKNFTNHPLCTELPSNGTDSTKPNLISPVVVTGHNETEFQMIQDAKKCHVDLNAELSSPSDKKVPNVQQVTWTGSKCRLLSITAVCLGLWAAIYFTLSSYGYV